MIAVHQQKAESQPAVSGVGSALDVPAMERLALGLLGAGLMMCALRSPRGRFSSVALAAAGTILARRALRRSPRAPQRPGDDASHNHDDRTRPENWPPLSHAGDTDAVQEASEESFPASDSPGWRSDRV
jgi:hypothetical protein